MKETQKKWSLPVEIKNPHRWESQLKEAIANAKSVQEAADSIGVSYNTFKSWCRKFGLLPEGDNPKGVLKKIKEKLTGTVNGLAGMPSSSLSPESGSSNDKQGMV